MFPEGDPESTSVQEILYWQYRTMESMYRRIGQAIKEFQMPPASTSSVGQTKQYHPTDYLSFYCLGKREFPIDFSSSSGFEEPKSGSKPAIIRYHPIIMQCMNND